MLVSYSTLAFDVARRTRLLRPQPTCCLRPVDGPLCSSGRPCPAASFAQFKAARGRADSAAARGRRRSAGARRAARERRHHGHGQEPKCSRTSSIACA